MVKPNFVAESAYNQMAAVEGVQRLEKEDRLYHFFGGRDGTGVVRDIHVKSRVHLLIGVIRGGIFNHHHLV
jgi:hypothetical protein